MKAVVITTPGGPEVLKLQEVEEPKVKDDDVLIRVEATALNGADTLIRQGKETPPKGVSEYLGLECSGTIEAVGKNVSRWKVGDQVCALISGGGYAEKLPGSGMHCLVNGLHDKQAIFRGSISGSDEKLKACKELGADVGINYKTEDFVARVKEEKCTYWQDTTACILS
ncbi:unnamed protein product [Lactuca virosa]|uniref:Alcohol dehydrogenase-like N-terminal domain-containing protein n=1 Tax=Lactuca virosa TaxID=75947 RepID=A0AAU9MRU0_9ASTR|nr:unnamed protein product [Lactuca virosa]